MKLDQLLNEEMWNDTHDDDGRKVAPRDEESKPAWTNARARIMRNQKVSNRDLEQISKDAIRSVKLANEYYSRSMPIPEIIMKSVISDPMAAVKLASSMFSSGKRYQQSHIVMDAIASDSDASFLYFKKIFRAIRARFAHTGVKMEIPQKIEDAIADGYNDNMLDYGIKLAQLGRFPKNKEIIYSIADDPNDSVDYAIAIKRADIWYGDKQIPSDVMDSIKSEKETLDRFNNEWRQRHDQ
jgi:hypothetical protein